MSPTRSQLISTAVGVSHGFFGRRGGVSLGVYSSLNCGFGSEDKVELVRENRARVANALGTTQKSLLTVYQIHGAEAVTLSTPWEQGDAPKADGMVTNARGIALGVLAADCAPVLFADPGAGVIGSAHAGWQGAFKGIIESVVASMEVLGAQRSRIMAAVGPCIGQANYEVGPEFFERFSIQTFGNERFFIPSSRGGHWMFDLSGYVGKCLKAAGVENVDIVGRCTYADREEFFSYRRATHNRESDYGRNMSAIMLVQ